MNSWALTGICMTASLLAPQRSVCQAHEYVGPEHRLLVPDKWNISATPNGVLTIFDYEPRDAGPQGLFPFEGAEILVLPLAAVERTSKAKTLDEWIAQNAAVHRAGVSRKRRADLRRRDGSAQGVIEVEADFERDSQDGNLQHEVSYYFTLRGRMFGVTLTYWKGNPNASNLRSVTESVVEAIQAA